MTNQDLSPQSQPGEPAAPDTTTPAVDSSPVPIADDSTDAPLEFLLNDGNAPLAGVDLQTGRTVQS